MILSYKNNVSDIPYSSSCVIHTKGVIYDGDIVSITSPIFTSTNFTSKVINTSERFNVPIRIDGSRTIVNDNDAGLKASLICDDNDIFNMYVKVNVV